jgi:hypothetical protein
MSRSNRTPSFLRKVWNLFKKDEEETSQDAKEITEVCSNTSREATEISPIATKNLYKEISLEQAIRESGLTRSSSVKATACASPKVTAAIKTLSPFQRRQEGDKAFRKYKAEFTAYIDRPNHGSRAEWQRVQDAYEKLVNTMVAISPRSSVRTELERAAAAFNKYRITEKEALPILDPRFTTKKARYGKYLTVPELKYTKPMTQEEAFNKLLYRLGVTVQATRQTYMRTRDQFWDLMADRLSLIYSQYYHCYNPRHPGTVPTAEIQIHSVYQERHSQILRHMEHSWEEFQITAILEGQD